MRNFSRIFDRQLIAKLHPDVAWTWLMVSRGWRCKICEWDMGNKENPRDFGTLQDALTKHDPVVTLASQPHPQGAPAGLTGPVPIPQDWPALFQTQSVSHRTYVTLLHGYNTATTPQKGLYYKREWTHIPTGKTVALLEENISSTKLGFDYFS